VVCATTKAAATSIAVAVVSIVRIICGASVARMILQPGHTRCYAHANLPPAHPCPTIHRGGPHVQPALRPESPRARFGRDRNECRDVAVITGGFVLVGAARTVRDSTGEPRSVAMARTNRRPIAPNDCRHSHWRRRSIVPKGNKRSRHGDIAPLTTLGSAARTAGFHAASSTQMLKVTLQCSKTARSVSLRDLHGTERTHLRDQFAGANRRLTRLAVYLFGCEQRSDAFHSFGGLKGLDEIPIGVEQSTRGARPPARRCRSA
jgi:hypothetical protein